MVIIKVFNNGFLDEPILKYFGEKYFEVNKSVFEKIAGKSEEAIVYYAANKDRDKKIYIGEIENTSIFKHSAEVKFANLTEGEYTSNELNRTLYGVLSNENMLDNNKNIPLIVYLDNQRKVQLLNRINKVNNKKFIEINSDIQVLKQSNNWEGIYRKFGSVSELYKNDDVWNNEEILSEIAFATGKLAVCGSMPFDIKKDSQKKKKFLSEKAKYRKEVELLFNRCLEIEPNNEKVLSGYAYYYYTNVQDLSNANGRRDGNISKEIDNFHNLIDKVLEKNPKRIADLYRKGYLIYKKEVRNDEFGTQEEIVKVNIKAKRSKAIEYLNRAVEVWNGLDLNNDKEKKEYYKQKNNIIKALYTMGCAYNDMFFNVWSISHRETINMDKDFLDLDNCIFNDTNINYLKNAKICFEKCWSVLGGAEDILSMSIESLNTLVTDRSEEVSDILYKFGITYLNIYYAIKNDMRYNDEKRRDFLETARKYFELSLNVKILKNRKLKEVYVKEKIARCRILMNEYSTAINSLSKLELKRNDSYVRNTLSLAYLLEGDYENTIKIINDDAGNKFNKTLVLAQSTLALAYYKSGKYEDGKRVFDKIDKNYINEDCQLYKYFIS